MKSQPINRAPMVFKSSTKPVPWDDLCNTSKTDAEECQLQYHPHITKEGKQVALITREKIHEASEHINGLFGE